MTRDLLQLDWDWDYVMNISESDFPVRPVREFEEHLRRWNGGNFIAIGRDHMLKFHEGQGMKQTFYNCDEHMFRIGQRSEQINYQHLCFCPHSKHKMVRSQKYF